MVAPDRSQILSVHDSLPLNSLKIGFLTRALCTKTPELRIQRHFFEELPKAGAMVILRRSNKFGGLTVLDFAESFAQDLLEFSRGEGLRKRWTWAILTEG